MNGRESEIDKLHKFDLKTYAKYILQDGSITEQREILSSLKSRLIFKYRKLSLEPEKVDKIAN